MREGDAIVAALKRNDGAEVDHEQSQDDVLASAEHEDMGDKQELEALTVSGRDWPRQPSGVRPH